MEVLLAVCIGILFACGLYLMLQRNLMKVLFGIILLSHAANLLIFAVGGLSRGLPAFIRATADTTIGGSADPLPEALILTAIVIGFGVLAFTVVIVRRVFDTTGSDDSDQLCNTDRE
jgi:multicomponent Na+:H+ antiporter subunit C